MGIHPDDIRMERCEERRLGIAAPKKIHVSNAGRGAWGAVAIAGGPVGIDVEEFPTDGPLPLRLLHAGEREFLDTLEPAPREIAFLRFWTAREAYLKASGQGIANSLDVVRAIARKGGSVELKRGAVSLGSVQTIIHKNCVAAVAGPDLS